MLVGPADEPAVDVVQVLVDDQALVERDHPLADPADLGGDPLVALRGIRPAARGAPARGGSSRPRCGTPGRPATLGWSRRKSATARVSGQQSGKSPAPLLDVVGLPVGRPVPVHVITARRVLVDQAVAVVVDPLVAEQVVLAVFARLDRDEQSRVFGETLYRPCGFFGASR